MCVSMCGAGGGGYLCSWSEFQKGFHKLKRRCGCRYCDFPHCCLCFNPFVAISSVLISCCFKAMLLVAVVEP